MGTFCGTERRRIVKIIDEYQKEIIDPIDFYDVVVSIQSIKDIIKGWNIKISKRFKKNYNKFINDPVLKIGIIGNSNKGKSFLLSKLSKIKLPSGTSIKTEGLSIKYPEVEIYQNRQIALLDSAGLETPVIKTNNETFLKKEQNLDSAKLKTNEIKTDNKINNMDEKGKKDQKSNIEEQENTRSELFKEQSREKIMTELFLQNYIIHNSDILIIVVGLLTYSEQKLLNRIKNELKRAKINKTLYVIHNLMTYTTIEQVESYIKDTLFQSVTFELEKNLNVNTQIGIQKGVSYYEKNSSPKIFHLIFANDYSEAGSYYNEYTLSFIENLYRTYTDLKGFDIIQTVKERFKDVSKDIIENPFDEIEFDHSDISVIRLIKPEDIVLKKCFIDELGFSNLRSSGFEPNYDYYRTNDQIIINIEAPGNCTLKSSIKFSGGYIIIKIRGFKAEDTRPVKFVDNYSGREYGNFSLDIYIKHEDFIIKNEKPKIERKNGVFIIVYQLEKNVLTGELV